MKKIITLFLMIVSSSKIAAWTTTELAQKLRYFDFIRSLRNESADFLKEIEDSMKQRVIEYSQRRMLQHADAKTEEYKQEYDKVSNYLDKLFREIDEIFVLRGADLDNRYATDEEKEKLISYIQDLAKPAIEEYMQSYRKSFAQYMKQNIDL